MKIKDAKYLKLRKMGDCYMMVGPSSDFADLTDVFSFNESAAYLMQKCLESDGFEALQLADWLVEGYGIGREKALTDSSALLDKWKSMGLLEE